MEAYKTWVRRNKDYVHSLESLANGLTWLLPERFSTSEIGPEAGFVKFCQKRKDRMIAYAKNERNGIIKILLRANSMKFGTQIATILGIITAVNDHIIETAPGKHDAGSNMSYSLCISALKDLETLVEVVAEQFYGDKKWNFIALAEASKVVVRLALFHKSGYKMLLHGGETPNDEEKSYHPSFMQQFRGYKGSGLGQNTHIKNPWSFEGRAMSALSRFGENARTVSNRVWMERFHQQRSILDPPNAPVMQRPTLSMILSKKGVIGALFIMGEILFITRPLIYVLFISKYGIRSWTPWFLSLAVDLVATSFLSYATKSNDNEKSRNFPLSPSEKDEVKRRKLLWALYLMREPFFCKYTRQRLESTGSILETIPIAGTLAGKVVELIIGAQSRYTYMSGS